MKHKLLNKLWLRVGMIVAIMTTALAGTMKADEATDVIDYAATSSEIGSTANNTWKTFTVRGSSSGVTYNIRSMGTTGSSTDALRWNANGWLYMSTTYSGYKLKSVSVTTSANKNIGIYASNTAYSAAPSGTALSTLAATSSGATYTFTSDYTYLALKGTASSTLITSINVVWETSGGTITETVATPTFSVEEGTYSSAQTVSISCATSGATIHYTTDGSAPTTSSSVYSSALTISETTTVKAMAVKEGMNNSAVASATYTINLPYSGPDYVRVTSLDYITNGAKVIIAARFNDTQTTGYRAMTATTSGKPTGVAFASTTSSNGEILPAKIVDSESTYCWTIGVTSDGYTFTNSSNQVLGYSSGTDFATNGNNTAWTITRATAGANAMVSGYEGFYITNKNNTGRGVAFNGSVFGAYATSNNNGSGYNFYLDIFVQGATPALDPAVIANNVSIAYDATNGSIGYEIENPVSDGVLTASVPSDSWLTLGTVDESIPFTCSANPTATDRSAIVTLTYTYGDSQAVTKEVTVTQAGDPDAPGTQDNPYTVAQARAAIDAGTGLTNVYAIGIISQVDSYNSTYNSITYWISDDGTTTNQLQVYSGKGLDNTNFTSVNDVVVGATVVVYGTLKKFNDTYEFDKNNYLTSYEAPAVAVEAPTFSPVAGTYAEAQSVTISTTTEGATIYYTTDGTEPVAGSNIYNTGSVVSVSTTTTIKAIAVKGSDESSVATATYFICSADDPYTVTDALAFPEYPANEVYVTGIVSTAPTAAPSSGALTYYISVDGEATNQLEVYKGKGLNQAAFEAQDDIQVGDIVTIYGNVVIYGTTNPIKEFASGNYLVSFERPDTPVENPTLTIANPANVTITATYGDSEILVNGDDATVESGTEITLFVTLATDYNLETLTVTGEGGQNVELTQGGDFWTFTMPEYSVTVNATASAIIDPATSHTYELVTDASTLAADDVIIIAYNSAEVHKAMGEQRTNNRASVDVTQSGTQIIAGNTVQQITLEGDADGWYFNVGDGYLYAASSSSNWLRTQSEEDDNAKATIEISSENYATITFQGTNTRNLLQYNNNNDIFSCYSSGQKAVQIYRLVETPTPETEEIKITSLKYSTYASDNALDFTESGIKAFYATAEGSTLTFHQIFKVPAGTGVLLYSPTAVTENIPVFTGTADEVTNNVFVRGTGVAVSYTETDKNYILFEGSNGIGFYKAKNNTVATNRAYIHVPASVNGVKYFTINLDDDPTGIDNLNDNLNSNGAIYNLAGQRLQKMQKGINIINGKKVLK